MKKIVPIVLILVLAGLSVKHFLLKEAFKYAGTLETTRIDLPARLATVVRTMAIEEGQVVKKGDKLFTLDCDELEVLQTQIARNFQRSNLLAKRGVVTSEANEDMKRRKDDVDLRLSWCEVTSPLDGTVLNRYVEAGEWVNPGSKLASIADVQDIWAYVYVPQKLMSRLNIGQEVAGDVPELTRTFKGKIIKINEEAEFTPKNVQTREERTRLVFGIKIKFENSDQILKPGMAIEVQLPQEGKHT